MGHLVNGLNLLTNGRVLEPCEEVILVCLPRVITVQEAGQEFNVHVDGLPRLSLQGSRHYLGALRLGNTKKEQPGHLPQ